MRRRCVRESAMRLSVFVRAQRPAFHIHFPPSRPFSSPRPPPISRQTFSLGFFSSSRGLVWVIWFGAKRRKIYSCKKHWKSREWRRAEENHLWSSWISILKKSPWGLFRATPELERGRVFGRVCLLVGKSIFISNAKITNFTDFSHLLLRRVDK